MLIVGHQNVWIKSRGYLRLQEASWPWLIAILSFLALAPVMGAYAQGLRPYEPLDPGKAQKLPKTPISIRFF